MEGRLQRQQRTAGWRLLPTTVLGTYAVILLGIYTAAVGAGLTCEARWPLCDGAVFGLFPANWPSFVEWFHRLVAMITGLLIVGSWVTIVRFRQSRRALYAMTAAIVLLPIQIWLGAGTVWGYQLLTLTAHFLVALGILACIISAATWYLGIAPRQWPGIVTAYAVLLAAMVPFLVLTPHFLFVHTGGVQMLYYGVGLSIVGVLVWITVTEYDAGLGLPAISITGALLVAVQLLAGRVVRTAFIHTVDWIAAGLTILVLTAGLLVSQR